MWELRAALGAGDGGEPAARKDGDAQVHLSDTNTSRHASARLHQNVFPTRWGRDSGDYRVDRGSRKEKPEWGWKSSHGPETLVLRGGGDKAGPRWSPSPGLSPRSGHSSPPAGPAPRSRRVQPLGKGCPDPRPPKYQHHTSGKTGNEVSWPKRLGAVGPHVQREDVCRQREASLAPDSTFV